MDKLNYGFCWGRKVVKQDEDGKRPTHLICLNFHFHKQQLHSGSSESTASTPIPVMLLPFLLISLFLPLTSNIQRERKVNQTLCKCE
jgi:hypothetical protein